MQVAALGAPAKGCERALGEPGCSRLLQCRESRDQKSPQDMQRTARRRTGIRVRDTWQAERRHPKPQRSSAAQGYQSASSRDAGESEPHG
jgi:hypothetical protein